MEWWHSVATPETLEALNLEIVGIGSITPEAGTFASVGAWVQALQSQVSYLVALNHRVQQRVQLPREQLFSEYFGSQTGKLFRETFNPKHVEIGGLYEGSMIQLAKSSQLPSEAANNPNIPLLDRTRIKTWASKVHSQLAEIL